MGGYEGGLLGLSLGDPTAAHSDKGEESPGVPDLSSTEALKDV